MASNTTILITGGNRGLGKGLVEHYLSQSNHTIVAGVRDPNHPTSKALFDLRKGHDSELVVVKIDSASETDPAEAINILETKHKITTVNIVLANAGICTVIPTVSLVKPEDMVEHFTVNVLGVVRLFQATLPLLNRAEASKFITISSAAGIIGDMENTNFPNAAYGTSKAALNYITRKIHFENEGLTAFPLSPGFAQTDMGNTGAKMLGLEKAFITVSESVEGMVKVIAESSKEKTSGRFMSYDGTELAW